MKRVIILTESQLKNVIDRLVSKEVISEQINFDLLPKDVIYNDNNSKSKLVNAGMSSSDPFKDPNFSKYYPNRSVNSVGQYVYQKVMNPPTEYTQTKGSGNKGSTKVPYNEKGYQKQRIVSSIPSELKNKDGVKLFQDWLDKNVKGWATGLPNGILNKSGGYGTFGPRTSAAWNKNKGVYLNSLKVPSTEYQSSGNLSQSKIYDPNSEYN